MSGDKQNGWCEALYRAKASELVLYGRALGLSHGEAEDVLQDTFIALLRREHAPATPEHYCVRAYRNRALNCRRSLWRRLAREWESRLWFERPEPENPLELEAMRCLASLPREQREVIVLKIWHEYTFEEVGELLNISPNTASGRYRYGLERLRRILKDTGYERHRRFGEAFALMGATPSIGEG